MPDTVLTPPEFAREYSTSHYDGWEIVDQYLLVVEWAELNPEATWYEAKKTLELPRNRVEKWYQGHKPRVVQKLEQADSLGWFDATWESDIGRAFNRITAALLSGGWLATNHTMGVVLDGDPDAEIVMALKDALCTLVGEYYIEPRKGNRANRLRPGNHEKLLARAVHAIGIPQGKKTKAELTLPEYLQTAPEIVRRDFVEIYVALRGSAHATGGIVLYEKRSESYLTALADLIEAVTGAPVSVGSDRVYLTKAAGRALDGSVSVDT